jgi:hypothetical protein
MAPLRKMVTHPLVWDYERVTGSKACISKVISAKGDPQVRCTCIDERVALEDAPSAPLRKY